MTHIDIAYLDHESPTFPCTANALTEEPNGLLAIGGNLNTNTLIDAYSRGIFPWYSPGEPILWWSPSPRMIIEPALAHYPRSLKKLARKKPFKITVDTCFESVIEHCSTAERKGQDGTWISDEMIEAYINLHQRGIAHSIEAWQEGKLVGGLYGICLGNAFFGESMFSLQSGASKIAFASLCEQLAEWKFELIDCQVHTNLLSSFGAHEVDREVFETKLRAAKTSSPCFDWRQQWSLREYGFDGS